MCAHADLQTGGKDGLAGRRVDRALVADIGADQHDASAIAVLPGRGLQACTALDDDIAVFLAGSQRRRLEGGCAIATTRHTDPGENELRVLVVEQTVADQVVVDRQCGSDKGPRVDLAGTAEYHTVAVYDIDLTLGVDAPADLRGDPGGIEDFVEGGPFAGIGSTLRLVKIDRRVATNVESFPMQNSLRLVLFDVHVVARRHGGVRPVPAGLAAGEDFESAGNQSVCHIIERRRRGPGCRLRPLHALER